MTGGRPWTDGLRGAAALPGGAARGLVQNGNAARRFLSVHAAYGASIGGAADSAVARTAANLSAAARTIARRFLSPSKQLSRAASSAFRISSQRQSRAAVSRR